VKIEEMKRKPAVISRNVSILCNEALAIHIRNENENGEKIFCGWQLIFIVPLA